MSWVALLIGGPNWAVIEQAGAQPAASLAYPAEVDLDGLSVLLRTLHPGDEEALLAFARSLPTHDLMFLRRDITRREQVDALVHGSASGLSVTLLAFHDGEVVGYATVASDGITWTRHVRELRVLVAASMRGRHLGRLLTEQAFAIAREQGARKMIAQMTVDQETAIAAFRRLGFAPEARLHNQVIDREGQLHDLQIMSLDVDAFQARLEFALTPAMPQI